MMLDKSSVRLTVLTFGFILLSGCSAPAVKEPGPVSPELAMEYAREGKVAYEQGRKREAEQAWRKAVALNPANPVVVNNLALLLQEGKRFGEAASLLEEGLRHSPDVAELHYNLAIISELYLIDLETALSHYQRYRSISGEEDKAVAGWIADLERRLD